MRSWVSNYQSKKRDLMTFSQYFDNFSCQQLTFVGIMNWFMVGTDYRVIDWWRPYQSLLNYLYPNRQAPIINLSNRMIDSDLLRDTRNHRRLLTNEQNKQYPISPFLFLALNNKREMRTIQNCRDPLKIHRCGAVATWIIGSSYSPLMRFLRPLICCASRLLDKNNNRLLLSF